MESRKSQHDVVVPTVSQMISEKNRIRLPRSFQVFNKCLKFVSSDFAIICFVLARSKNNYYYQVAEARATATSRPATSFVCALPSCFESTSIYEHPLKRQMTLHDRWGSTNVPKKDLFESVNNEPRGTGATTTQTITTATSNTSPTNGITQCNIEKETRDWIKNVVIGFNLCPFAAKPVREDGQFTVHVVRGNDESQISSILFDEMKRLVTESGTSIIVSPDFNSKNFYDFLDFVQYMEDEMMEESGLDGVLQIATFHPLYEFAGSGREDADNYTNRSPYPMFHILKEDEVANAVDRLGGDSKKVWGRNMELLKEMESSLGRENFERSMSGHAVNGLDALLKSKSSFLDDQ